MKVFLERARIRLFEEPVPPVSSIRRAWRGVAPAWNHSLCLFANWDRDGELDDYVVHAIEAWRSAGFDVVLISTSPKLTEQAIERARRCCCYVLWRENIGLDFGSWKAAYDWVVPELGKPTRMVLTNDSVFGPFSALEPMVARASERGLTGLTSSYEHGRHLQSYCLLLSEQLLASAAFERFWSGIRLVADKDTIIAWYELGFSNGMRAQGEAVSVIYPIEDVLYEARCSGRFQYDQLPLRRLNPTLHLWDTLIEEFNFPFLKTELLKRNRIRSARLAEWTELIPSDNGALVDAIERHVARVTRSE